jgi:hypothetical protein
LKSPPVKPLYRLDSTRKTILIQVREDLIYRFSDIVRLIIFDGLFAFGFASKGRLVLMPMILVRVAREA